MLEQMQTSVRDPLVVKWVQLQMHSDTIEEKVMLRLESSERTPRKS